MGLLWYRGAFRDSGPGAPSQEPVTLEEFIKQHHAESAELPPFEP